MRKQQSSGNQCGKNAVDRSCIIITPVISVTLTRIMFQSENAMIVDDALQRIDSVLHLKPLEETKHSKHPQNASVELKSVHFSYDGEKEVLKDISH